MDWLAFNGAYIRFLKWTLTPVYWLLTRSEAQRVRPSLNPLLRINATDLAEKIRKREIRSEDVVKTYIERIKEVNPIINAIFEERFTLALEESREADQYIAKYGEVEDLANTRPLLGVPITIKESCRVKGMSLTGGTPLRQNEKATEDSVAVFRLKTAGAIVLLVSATPEYCLSWETNNFVKGKARNPYNSHKTPGGSSGGEGALLGTGASLIGLGSDIAGSIRLPAHFNGVFGHKPTKRLVPSHDHFITCPDDTIFDYLTLGPMARYSKDLKLLLKILCGPEATQLNLDEEVKIENLNVFTLEKCESSMMMVPVQDEIVECVRRAAAHLKTVGCSISDYKFDLTKTTHMSISLFYDIKDMPNLLEKKDGGEYNLFLEIIKSALGISQFTFQLLFFYYLMRMNGFVPKSKLEYYSEMRDRVKKEFMDKLSNNGILLYPTFPKSALYHNQTPLYISSICYVMLFNILGMPSCNVPMGLDKQGMPIGIQVIAAPYQDRLCLAVAEELEKAFGGWVLK